MSNGKSAAARFPDDEALLGADDVRTLSELLRLEQNFPSRTPASRRVTSLRSSFDRAVRRKSLGGAEMRALWVLNALGCRNSGLRK